FLMRVLKFAALLCAAAAFAQSAPPELKYAVILTRHGVRSPTWTLERLNQYSASPWPDFGVAPGDLTPRGRELMKKMGAWYAEWLHRPAGCAAAKRVSIWSDTGQRATETAKALAEGMLPGCATEIHTVPEALFNGGESQHALAAVAGRIGPELDVL